MSALEQILAILGTMTDEQKATLASALAQEADVAEPAVAEIEIPFMDSTSPVEQTTDEVVEVDGTIYRKATIKEVNDMIDKRNKVAKFGTTTQVNNKGESYEYIRSEFDGFAGELDEKHQEMRNHFIEFSKQLRETYSDFLGAGPIAITMHEPENPASNKEGKVFYRWDNPSKTQTKMDELYPMIAPLVEAMKAIKVQGEGQ